MPSTLSVNITETGQVRSFYNSVARLSGLPHVGFHEVLLDSDQQEVAIVLGYEQDAVEAVFFNEEFDPIQPIYRGYRTFEIPVSAQYLGRVVNGLGRSIDGYGDIGGKHTAIFCDAPSVLDRSPVQKPLSTGIKVLDTTLPIGRGQRELIIGNRKLGKSSIALSTIINQQHEDPPVYCVYVLCGQKARKVDHVIDILKKYDALDYSVVVAATSDQSYAMQYLAPFVGCTIAEYFRNQGQDALVVYDDLSKHAKAYRDISLLLERIPGREAYPGDIFSLYAQLLERAGQLTSKMGGGSLTALPIIETQQSDITAYIPTNIISITDGQVYLDEALFNKQYLPAVNVGLSVSRIGSQAQPPLLREVTKGLRLVLAQHKELQKLTQLETTISQETMKQIHRGKLVLDLLKQDHYQVLPWEEQVILFYAVEHGFFDDLEPRQWQHFEKLLLELLQARYKPMLQKIRNRRVGKIKAFVHKAIIDFKQEFLE